MMATLKPDADKIVAHIDYLKSQEWLAASQKWWPDHLFHFTDLTNALSILAGGALLCRSELEKRGQLVTDIASPEVIGATESHWKDYVRLYFRPRTPTQYNNEGFRPINQRKLGGAHCPVPIVFIFHAKPILTQPETRFSDGNLAAEGAHVGQSANFFVSLPFQRIYHDGSLWDYTIGQKGTIIYHRHAEVIVPHSLDLSSLKLIWCRSQAEFETLIHLLPVKVRRKWANKLGTGTKPMLFYARWSFVVKADLSSSEISFAFNPSLTPGPFHARLEILETKSKITYSWEDEDFYARESQVFSLSKMKYPENYTVKLLLDGQLAYQNKFIAESEVPF